MSQLTGAVARLFNSALCGLSSLVWIVENQIKSGFCSCNQFSVCSCVCVCVFSVFGDFIVDRTNRDFGFLSLCYLAQQSMKTLRNSANIQLCQVSKVDGGRGKDHMYV